MGEFGTYKTVRTRPARTWRTSCTASHPGGRPASAGPVVVWTCKTVRMRQSDIRQSGPDPPAFRARLLARNRAPRGPPDTARPSAKWEQLEICSGFSSENGSSKGRNLALTVLSVPNWGSSCTASRPQRTSRHSRTRCIVEAFIKSLVYTFVKWLVAVTSFPAALSQNLALTVVSVPNRWTSCHGAPRKGESSTRGRLDHILLYATLYEGLPPPVLTTLFGCLQGLGRLASRGRPGVVWIP